MRSFIVVAVDHSISVLQSVKTGFVFEKNIVLITVNSFIELRKIPSPDIVIYDIGICLLEGDIYNFISKRCITVAASAVINENTVEKAIACGASALIKKPYDCSTLKEKLNSLLQAQPALDSRISLDKKISHIFLSGGITPNNMGFRYLKESVKLCISNPNMLTNITKMLYPAVAEKFDTKSTRVERDIRHVIELAWSRGKIQNLNKVFGLNIFDTKNKPTNSEFIALLADKLSYEQIEV